MKIIKSAIVILSICYLIITILFNMPNNPIRATMGKEMFDFSILFNQKWSFFAPPPQSNTNLYFSYYDKDKKHIKTYEVLETILNEKRIKTPFNTREEALDYIINGCINQFTSFIIYKREQHQLLDRDANISNLDSIARKDLLAEIDNLKEFNTLIAFSKLLKNEKNINARFVELTVTQTDIPKFIDRNKKIKSEKLLLKSNLTEL